MPTKTTKKPSVPGIAWDKLTDNEKMLVKSFASYVDSKMPTAQLQSLDERLCDEVNKGHALYLHIEAFEKRIRDIEGRMSSLLTIEDLRKVNVTMALLEKDAEGLKNESVKAWGMLGEHRGALADMKGKIADIASIIPSCLKDTAELKRTVGVHDAQLEINFSDVRRTQGLHKERLDKIDERMNMAECDIEKLHDPLAFGREDKPAVTSKDVVSILQSAKHRVASYQNTSAMSAIIFCTFPGELRSRVLLALYLSVIYIWELGEKAPTVLTDEAISQLLYEWHDGMVLCKEDVLLAFNVAIKKETLRA